MDSRRIGRSDLTTAPIALGSSVFGWTVPEGTAFDILDRFVARGFDLIDTADVYSAWVAGHKGGESETIIGAWLKARPGAREKVLILTKCGMEMPGQGKGLSPAWIAKSCEDSLKRLGIERIDLYQAHKDDEGVPLAETLGAFQALIKAGKVRAIGSSNYTAARLKAALEVSAAQGLPRFESHQPVYNLMDRGIEAELLPLCRAEEVAIITYSSLASGFLTGKYRNKTDLGKSVRGERSVAKHMTDKGMAVLAAVDAAAKRHGVSQAAIALAWQIARPGITAPIASATSPEQLAELAVAGGLDLAAAD
ncbi:MAG: alcohol dehydrogenase, partial [Mesorhizobium sp. SCN 65-12]